MAVEAAGVALHRKQGQGTVGLPITHAFNIMVSVQVIKWVLQSKETAYMLGIQYTVYMLLVG